MYVPSVLTRIVAVLYLIFTFAHTFGVLGTPSRGEYEDKLLDSLQKYTFEFMGTELSHWKFYQGSSLLFSVNLAFLTVLAWYLAGNVKAHPSVVRPILFLFSIVSFAIAVLSYPHFFILPVIFSGVSSVLLTAAGIRAKSVKPASART
eukprot:EC720261.1.p1 GENE.EC720261.1~~EC720261.1.p1  ORF type:complete len:148 (+),score=21.31 EC720261.1:41-484(+)